MQQSEDGQRLGLIPTLNMPACFLSFVSAFSQLHLRKLKYTCVGGHTFREALESSEPVQVRVSIEYMLALTEVGLTEIRALIFELRPERWKPKGWWQPSAGKWSFVSLIWATFGQVKILMHFLLVWRLVLLMCCYVTNFFFFMKR